MRMRFVERSLALATYPTPRTTMTLNMDSFYLGTLVGLMLLLTVMVIVSAWTPASNHLPPSTYNVTIWQELGHIKRAGWDLKIHLDDELRAFDVQTARKGRQGLLARLQGGYTHKSYSTSHGCRKQVHTHTTHAHIFSLFISFPHTHTYVHT